MAERASTEPHFFKVLLPNFTNQLQLPRAFVNTHIFNEVEKAGSVSLLSPDCKTWNVTLHKNQQDAYLSGDEWRACTQALDLKVGYFLLFSYSGNLLFSFKVFDLSTCQKAYPPPVCYPKSRVQHQFTNISARTIVASVAAKRSTRNSVAVAKTTKRKTTATAAADTKRTKKCKIGHNFEVVGQHGNTESFTSICKICKCTRFEACISPSSLCQYMRIPVLFLEFAFDGAPKELERLTLVGRKRRSWTIELSHPVDRKAKVGYSTRMAKGWKEFSLENQLELGDRCVFDLEAGEKEMMHFQIFKA